MGPSDRRVGGEVNFGYRTDEVALKTGVTYRQLDQWDHIGFITPSVRSANGSGGGPRLYSEEDVRLVTVTKRLLDLGFRLAAIRQHGPDHLDALVDWALHRVEVSA